MLMQQGIVTMCTALIEPMGVVLIHPREFVVAVNAQKHHTHI